jgi:plastocyanin
MVNGLQHTNSGGKNQYREFDSTFAEAYIPRNYLIHPQGGTMKTFLPLILAILLVPAIATATRHAITTPGIFFSPNTLTMPLGDTVVFTVSATHNAVEVSQATWNANGSSPLAGGFSFGASGTPHVLGGLTVGTHYFVCQPHVGSGMKGQIIVTPLTDVGDEIALVPQKFELEQNYPNPFNPSTSISFSIARTSHTEIAVYDALGRLMKTLVDETLPAGQHTTSWNGTDEKGEPAGTGAYFIVMVAGENGRDYFGSSRVLLIR